MDNVQHQIQSEIQENKTTLSLEELRSVALDRGTTNTRFCGRVWRVDSTSTSAFTRFFQDVDVAREHWLERERSSESTDNREDGGTEDGGTEDGTTEDGTTDVETANEPEPEPTTEAQTP